MRIRTALTTCLTLASLTFAGCGGSAPKAETPKVEDLTEADKAAYNADQAKVADAEKAHQAKEPPDPAEASGSDEEKRAAKKKRR